MIDSSCPSWELLPLSEVMKRSLTQRSSLMHKDQCSISLQEGAAIVGGTDTIREADLQCLQRKPVILAAR